MKALHSVFARTARVHLNTTPSHIPHRFSSTTSAPTYGFIGLGQMGSRMANNLITKTTPSGSSVYVYDKYEPAVQAAVQSGGIAASTPSEMVAHCDFLITMLRSDEQVQTVYDELLSQQHQFKDGVIFIDSSTVNYETSRELASQMPPNAECVDAPVSGGIGAAAAALLTFMCGGKPTAVEKAKPVLQTMGANVFHCGDANGSGQIAKICNNLILAISMCAVSEGMNLGVKLGMDAQKLADIVNVSSGRCWSSDQYNPCPAVTLFDNEGKPKLVPSKNNYDGGFVVDLMRKDLGLALDAAKSCNANTPLAASVSQLYDMLAQRGFGNKDFGFIYQFIKGSEHLQGNGDTKAYGA
eukprot:CAMPEP_0197026850 /NCGR_PEP_ID=MMETSP1384-20130603/6857_1 /TAXON_ID=29189 /ORGANISM="Ammonia sp." /LENGTH=353 /DNA_ID=CAMNT_0042455595 /DNA_START=37 /DNA_END=1098 /DNA_ORIENTATION=-